MENRRNYYRILHVQRDAPPEIIRNSYRTLMQTLRMHPDLGGDHWNASLINEAYAVLSDPQKRSAYDLALRPAAEEAQAFAQADSGTEESATTESRQTREHGRSERPKPRATQHAVDRLRKRMVVTVLAGGTEPPALETETLDVSPGGLRFISRIRLPVGKLVRVECELCSSVAEVRNCSPAGTAGLYTIGLAFRNPDFRRRHGAFVSVAA